MVFGSDCRITTQNRSTVVGDADYSLCTYYQPSLTGERELEATFKHFAWAGRQKFLAQNGFWQKNRHHPLTLYPDRTLGDLVIWVQQWKEAHPVYRLAESDCQVFVRDVCNHIYQDGHIIEEIGHRYRESLSWIPYVLLRYAAKVVLPAPRFASLLDHMHPGAAVVAP